MNERESYLSRDQVVIGNEKEFSLKILEVFGKGVVSSFLQNNRKPLCLSSQLHDVSRLVDPRVAGDHPYTMIEFLGRSLLATVKEEVARGGFVPPQESEKDPVELTDSTGDKSAQELFKEGDVWKAVKPCQDLPRKKSEALRFLRDDAAMVDLKISLYITACNHIAVKPYPEHVVDETAEGMHGLVFINNLIPPVDVLRDALEKDSNQLNEHVVNIVHWLSVSLRQPKLVDVPKTEYDAVFDRVEFAVNAEAPDFMVKLMVNNLSSNHLQWQAAKGQQATKFAFYNLKVEQIHSLIHLGLFPTHKTDGALGKGVYLTTDLKRCLDDSPPCWSWGKSALGTQLRAIAVVEFIASSPKVVGYRDKNAYSKRELAAKSPYHYYVPYINLVQARYLLVYVTDHRLMTPQLSRPFARRRRATDHLLLHGLFFGLYVSLCLVAWKSICSSSQVSPWQVLAEKLPIYRWMEKFSQKMRSTSEMNAGF